MSVSRQSAYTAINGLSTANLKLIGNAAVDATVALQQLGIRANGLHPNFAALRDLVQSLVGGSVDG
jgi:hypothetical protein